MRGPGREGVGAFGDAMACLNRSGLVRPVLSFIDSGKPFLGVCLGLQLLFEGSEEAPGVPAAEDDSASIDDADVDTAPNAGLPAVLEILGGTVIEETADEEAW